MNEQQPVATNWHPDPTGRYPYRWWDGTQWTSSVLNESNSVVTDPLGIAHGQRSDGQTAVQQHPEPTQGLSPQAAPQLPMPHQGFPQPVAPVSMQTPNFNLPGGGPWAAPQQLVVTNASKSPGMAIASLILGIGAFFFSLIPIIGLLSIPFAIVGLALGISGIVRANKGFEGRGLAITGVVSSLAALFVSAVYLFAIGGAVNELPTMDSDPSDGICDTSRMWQDPDC